MDNKNILKATILKKLKRRNKWGKSHTSINKLSAGLPKHLSGDVKKAGEDLIKSGILLSKPTSYGLEVSLNPKRKNEIDKIIKKYLPRK